MKEVNMGMGRMGIRFLEEGREWRLPGLLYTVNLVWGGEYEEDSKVMVGRFIKVYRKKGLKGKADESNMMVLGVE